MASHQGVMCSYKIGIVLLLYYHYARRIRMPHTVLPQTRSGKLQNSGISARISEDRRCFPGPLRLAVQDFCGADEIGGC